jgi:VWFA-related protein
VWLLGAATGFHPVRGQEPQRPPTFRTGTHIIRVDATVTDRSGNPLTNLTADDFEIREDGKVQTISSFKFIAADGQPTDDRSLPIRSQSHAAAEAAREDVRTFLILWDEYHIDPFVSALRGREALTRAVLGEFGPTDLVGVMDQLTPISAIEFSRDRRALANQVHALKGRLGEYVPPRSAVEEAHLQVARHPGEIELFRTQVTVTAVKAAAAHLGTFGAGRKTLIIVTQALWGAGSGRGAGGMMPVAWRAPQLTAGDVENMAIDIARAANDSNTAIHVIDPRGLRVNSSLAGGPLDTITYGTGGDLHRTNDAALAFRQMLKQVGALYLLGYTRDMPTDGLFHQIRVRVKRGGADVRAREGYWAPRAEDIESAKRQAALAVLPPAVAESFATLAPAGAPRLIEVWTGWRALPDGRLQVTVAWSPRAGAAAGAVPAAVSASVKAGEKDLAERSIDPGGTTFEAPPGAVQIALRVMNKEGEVVDRETRTVAGPDPAAALSLTTPVVHRARTPAEARAMQATAHPSIHAGREFVRADRVIVRVLAHGTQAPGAKITARLINRRGATLVQLPVNAANPGGEHQLELPLTSIAAGEFAIAFEASAGGSKAEALVPFRVVR